MIDQKYVELMNRSMDHAITPAEQGQLNEYLKSSPEAAAFYADLLELEAGFKAVPRAEPPQELMQSILRSIPNRSLEKTTASVKLVNWYSRTRQLFAPPVVRWVAVGASAFAIILVGLVALNLTDRTLPTQVQGTLAPVTDAPETQDRQTLVVGSGTVSFTTTQIAGGAEVTVELSGREITRFEFEFNPADLAMAPVNTLPESISHWQETDGRLSFVVGGEQSVVLRVRKTTSDSGRLTIGVRASGADPDQTNYTTIVVR